MVKRILKNPKSSFLEALIITVFIFGTGLLLGIFLENSRTNTIANTYIDSEINLLDIQMLSDLILSENLSCEYAISENVDFGNRIYEDTLLIAKYEKSNQLKTDILKEHKRYDLLRTLFWINSINLRERCSDLHTLVYLYDFKTESSEDKQQQTVFSKFASELHNDFGNTIVLIPIAMDMDLSSLDVLLEKYNINETTLLFDETFKMNDISDGDAFEDIVKRGLLDIGDEGIILN